MSSSVHEGDLNDWRRKLFEQGSWGLRQFWMELVGTSSYTMFYGLKNMTSQYGHECFSMDHTGPATLNGLVTSLARTFLVFSVAWSGLGRFQSFTHRHYNNFWWLFLFWNPIIPMKVYMHRNNDLLVKLFWRNRTFPALTQIRIFGAWAGGDMHISYFILASHTW